MVHGDAAFFKMSVCACPHSGCCLPKIDYCVSSLLFREAQDEMVLSGRIQGNWQRCLG